jgi:TDG/mug DNA glycosylase family protein
VKRTGLPPIVAAGCSVLVLGSMPGEISLQRGEYYAHPRNRFWPVMARLAGVDPELDYAARVRQLTRRGIAVWDVLAHCERPGSLDTSIRRGTEVLNDFPRLFEAYPSLAVLALNGSKAAQTFRRRVLSELGPEVADRLTLFDMPSTSPANASRSLEDLLRAWSRLAPFLSAPPSNPSGGSGH